MKVFRSFREDVPGSSQVKTKHPRSQKRCRFCVDRAAGPRSRSPCCKKTARGAAQYRRRTRRTFAAHSQSPITQSSHQSDCPETLLLKSFRNPAGRKSPGAKSLQEGGADINASKTFARDIFNVSSQITERRWGDALVPNEYREDGPAFEGL